MNDFCCCCHYCCMRVAPRIPPLPTQATATTTRRLMKARRCFYHCWTEGTWAIRARGCRTTATEMPQLMLTTMTQGRRRDCYCGGWRNSTLANLVNSRVWLRASCPQMTRVSGGQCCVVCSERRSSWASSSWVKHYVGGWGCWWSWTENVGFCEGRVGWGVCVSVVLSLKFVMLDLFSSYPLLLFLRFFPLITLSSP